MYKRAFSRINQANEAGFHLESITIIESLLADRLESRLSFLLEKDFSFRTLGDSIQNISRHEQDPELRGIVLDGLRPWSRKRNTALHEMAKMSDADARAWEEKYTGLQEIADEGLSILRQLQDRMRKVKRAATIE